MKGAVTLTGRAAITIRIKFDDTGSVYTDSDTDKLCILLSIPFAEAAIFIVDDLEFLRSTSEVTLALELTILTNRICSRTSSLARRQADSSKY